MELYYNSIAIGIMYYDFWEMTPREVSDYIIGYNKRIDIDNRKMYLLADLISAFVWTRYGGKKIPPYEEIFPPVTEEEEKKARNDNNNKIRAMMEVFMINHNAQRHKEVK